MHIRVYTHHVFRFKLDSEDRTGTVDLVQTLDFFHDFFQFLLWIDPKSENVATALNKTKQ